jgi:hypothetical protein
LSTRLERVHHPANFQKQFLSSRFAKKILKQIKIIRLVYIAYEKMQTRTYSEVQGAGLVALPKE